MMRVRPPTLRAIVGSLFAAGALGSTVLQAAEYPNRPIRMIVPQAPGSASDNVARIVAAELGPRVGQQIVVDNRPGGALMIGMEMSGSRRVYDRLRACRRPRRQPESHAQPAV